nr:uncharacterized protein LOC113811277 [Penaeus vannamei]
MTNLHNSVSVNVRVSPECDVQELHLTPIRHIKDGEGMVLNEEEKIRDRWKSDFESLLNEENPRADFDEAAPKFGVTCDINRQEVKEALRKMKNGKATGPDNIPAEVWKCLGDKGIDMLWDLMTKVYEELKIEEEINESRIRKEIVIGDEQFGFLPGKGNAVFALRQLIERHREMKQGLHMVFIYLVKAYDRLLRQELWRCMRRRGMPEKYVRIMQDMYEGARTRMRTSVGTTG